MINSYFYLKFTEEHKFESVENGATTLVCVRMNFESNFLPSHYWKKIYRKWFKIVFNTFDELEVFIIRVVVVGKVYVLHTILRL